MCKKARQQSLGRRLARAWNSMTNMHLQFLARAYSQRSFSLVMSSYSRGDEVQSLSVTSAAKHRCITLSSVTSLHYTCYVFELAGHYYYLYNTHGICTSHGCILNLYTYMYCAAPAYVAISQAACILYFSRFLLHCSLKYCWAAEQCVLPLQFYHYTITSSIPHYH